MKVQTKVIEGLVDDSTFINNVKVVGHYLEAKAEDEDDVPAVSYTHLDVYKRQMMILPIADALQNTLQDLVSRIAGVNNDELANRGIGMAGAMAYSIKTIAYQFKGSESQVNNNLSLIHI